MPTLEIQIWADTIKTNKQMDGQTERQNHIWTCRETNMFQKVIDIGGKN